MPLLWLSLAFLIGIFTPTVLTLPISFWIVMAIVSLVLIVPPINRIGAWLASGRAPNFSGKTYLSNQIFIPLLVLFISLGSIRYITSRPMITRGFIAYYNDRPASIILEGVVVELPDVRDTYVNLRVRVERLRQVDEQAFTQVGGLVLIRTSPDEKFQYGDRISVRGQVQTPTENEDFSYREYLAHQGIYSTISSNDISLVSHGNGNPLLALVYAFRQHALKLVYRLLPDPEASLVAGIILGTQAGIPTGVQEAFRLTGTSHIIVISGFNITIIAGLFTFLFSHLLGRYKGAIAAAAGIVFYTVLVGANAAVVRAAILGLLALVGHLIGRRQSGLNSLSFAAAVMAIFSPTILWDVSFQLSFAATLGIMLYAEPFTQVFTNLAARVITQEKAERLAGPVGEYFFLTLAAQITTLPLMAYYFQRISLTALVANPLILPAQPPLMILGGLAVLSGVIFQPLGQLLAWVAWPFAAYTIRMVEWLARIPNGSIALGQVALPMILVFYTVLFLVTSAYKRITNQITRLAPVIPLTILVGLTVMVWKTASSSPDGQLHVSVLDVGTGEAVLIQSPTGRSVLLNGGESTIKLSEAMGRRLSPFNRSLDWLVVADIDDEDLAGIPGNLERFTPTNVLWAGNTYGTQAASELWSEVSTKSIPRTMMQPGQKLDLGSGVLLEVISTDARGAVLLLEWDRFRMLLPLGMDFGALESLQENSTIRNLSALLLAESGYAPLNPRELITWLRPQVALLSVAAGDRTGLPSPETLEALEGHNLLRTYQNGWIEIKTYGIQMWVEVERN